MSTINDITPNLGLALPHPANDADVDILRLRNMIQTLDAAVPTLLERAMGDALGSLQAELQALLNTVAPARTALSTEQWTPARAALLDRLDARIGSRAPADTALSNEIWTNALAQRVASIPTRNGGVLRYQEFTSSGLFVPSAALLANGGQVWVSALVGGGAGGATGYLWYDAYGNPGGAPGRSGGGGEVLLDRLITITAPVAVTIGSGGAAGAGMTNGAASLGTDGGQSSIGALLTAAGGRADGTSGNGNGPIGNYAAVPGPPLKGFGGSVKGPGSQGGGAGGPAHYITGASIYTGDNKPTKPNQGWGGRGGGQIQPWGAGEPGQAGYALIWWLE